MVGISGDRMKTLQLFKKENQLNFTLISDTTGNIARKFGVSVKEGGSVTQKIGGQEITLIRDVTALRNTFIIDREGKIAHIDKKVDAAQDSKNIIAIIKRLGLKK